MDSRRQLNESLISQALRHSEIGCDALPVIRLCSCMSPQKRQSEMRI